MEDLAARLYLCFAAMFIGAGIGAIWVHADTASTVAGWATILTGPACFGKAIGHLRRAYTDHVISTRRQ